MSEPLVDDAAPFLLDGEAPRLGGSTPMSAAVPGPPTAPAPEAPVLAAPVLAAPVLAAPVLTGPVPALPQLPGNSTPRPVAAEEPAPVETTPQHPMVHLMPQTAGPSEASKRAAGIRTAKKTKARRVKIGVAIGALVVATIAGPPLARWLVDAINDAGSTSPEVEG